MRTYLKLLPTFITFFFFTITYVDGQSKIDDSHMRESAALRIKKTHGIDVDWRNASLLEISNIELRLDTVARIKREHAITLDWQNSSLQQLIDAEARINTAKRIVQTSKKDIDWKQYSLEELLHMELSLKQANMTPGKVLLTFDNIFPPANQHEMGLHKLTDEEKEVLRKHVELLLITVAQAGDSSRTTQQPPHVSDQQNTTSSGLRVAVIAPSVSTSMEARSIKARLGYMEVSIKEADAVLVVVRSMLFNPLNLSYDSIKELQDDAENQLNISGENFHIYIYQIHSDMSVTQIKHSNYKAN